MPARDSVLDTALDLLNTRPAATMAQIAEHCGISRATLHRAFASREELIHALGVRALDDWEAVLDAVTASTAPRDRAYLEYLVTRYLASADIFGFTLTDPVLESYEDLEARAAALDAREFVLLETLQDTGALRADVPARWISRQLFGLLVAARESLRHGEIAPRDLAGFVVTALLEGNGS